MAHSVSSVMDSGTAPSEGTRRAVFLKPTMPHRAAGMRIEPPVSEPSPTKAAPAATETAAPDEEPPGMRGVAWSQGLAGVPWCGLMPTPENANSTMLVRPMMAPPAALSRATAGLSARAGALSAKPVEPAGVGWPAMSNKSLTETLKPPSGWLAASGCAATWRASSNMVRKKTWALPGAWAAAMDFSISAPGLEAPWRKRCRVV